MSKRWVDGLAWHRGPGSSVARPGPQWGSRETGRFQCKLRGCSMESKWPNCRPSDDVSTFLKSEVFTCHLSKGPSTAADPQRCHSATGSFLHPETPQGPRPLCSAPACSHKSHTARHCVQEKPWEGEEMWKVFAFIQKKTYYSKATVYLNWKKCC